MRRCPKFPSLRAKPLLLQIRFATAELDILVGQTQTKAPDPNEAVPPIDPNCAAISQVGDVWRLGRHRLSCGSALEEASYARLLGQERAHLLFTDPPYNVPIAGHVSALGKITHPELQMGSGELSSPGYVNFLSTAFGHCATFGEDGAIHFVCIDWRRMKEMLAAGEAVYSELATSGHPWRRAGRKVSPAIRAAASWAPVTSRPNGLKTN